MYDLSAATDPNPVMDRAAGWLLARQQPDGTWQDFDLFDQYGAGGAAIGVSDQWVTAYTALALADWAWDSSARVKLAVLRAAAWLDAQRTYPAGWGFNGRSGADADSTAHTLLLFARVGRPARQADEDLLLSAFCGEGGFATFPGAAGEWGAPHADITPRVLAALSPGRRRELTPRVLRFLARHRRADGTWSSYWWATALYPTFHALVLLAGLGESGRASAPVSIPTGGAIDGSLASGIDALRGFDHAASQRMGALALQQRADGSWPGSRCLRVPPRDGEAHVAAAHYADRGIFTAATVLSVAACTNQIRRTRYAAATA